MNTFARLLPVLAAHVMKLLLLLALVLTALVAPLLFTACAGPGDHADAPPNIVCIVAADHVPQLMGCYGATPAETPNIDRLTAGDVRLGRHYATAAIPTSYITDWATSGADTVLHLLPRLLREEGYRTALVGRWQQEGLPADFDYWKILSGEGDYYNPDFILQSNDTVRRQGYLTDLITDEALDWLNQRRDTLQPFFLLIRHKTLRPGCMPDTCNLTLYEDRTFALPTAVVTDCATFDPQHEYCLSRLDKAQRTAWDRFYAPILANLRRRNLQGTDLVVWTYQRRMRDYLKTLKSLDDSVGRLLAYIEANGLLDNTLVVYAPDPASGFADAPAPSLGSSTDKPARKPHEKALFSQF